MTRFRSVDLVVQEKPDGSPVSDADRAVEQALRARLRDERPDHGITGEELGSTGSSDWRWYLDPIDGTSDFVAGGSDWKTLIALAHADRVLVGVVSSPALGSRWWATRGDGAFRDGVRLSVSRTSRLADATVSDDWRQTIARGVNGHPLTAIAARSANFRPREGHTFLEVAQGRVDVGVGIGGFAWDYAPMQVIVEEAGGRFSDLSGRARFDAGDALASNGRVHDEALRALAGGD